jgi:hypothetical protein
MNLGICRDSLFLDIVYNSIFFSRGIAWQWGGLGCYIMNVVGAFFKPKGMTNHSKRPYLDLKDFFHTPVNSMGI